MSAVHVRERAILQVYNANKVVSVFYGALAEQIRPMHID